MDEGNPIHYMAVPRGTPVYGSDGVEVGAVVEMLDNPRENIFDGVVFSGGDGKVAIRGRARGREDRGTRRHPDDRLRSRPTELDPPQKPSRPDGTAASGACSGPAEIGI